MIDTDNILLDENLFKFAKNYVIYLIKSMFRVFRDLITFLFLLEIDILIFCIKIIPNSAEIYIIQEPKEMKNAAA